MTCLLVMLGQSATEPSFPQKACLESPCGYEMNGWTRQGTFSRDHVLALKKYVFLTSISTRMAFMKVMLYGTWDTKTYSAAGAVITPRPKNSLIVPNLSRLLAKAF